MVRVAFLKKGSHCSLTSGCHCVEPLRQSIGWRLLSTTALAEKPYEDHGSAAEKYVPAAASTAGGPLNTYAIIALSAFRALSQKANLVGFRRRVDAAVEDSCHFISIIFAPLVIYYRRLCERISMYVCLFLIVCLFSNATYSVEDSFLLSYTLECMKKKFWLIDLTQLTDSFWF